MLLWQKATLALLFIMALVAALWFGVHQYGNARATAQELGSVKDAVSEAVAERKEATRVDAIQASQNVALSATVKAVVRKQKEKSREVPEVCSDPVGDAERARLLNEAIGKINRVISAASTVPDALSDAP